MNNKKYLSKIIAKDQSGINVISACCSEAKAKVEYIKFLKKNKIFLLPIERINKEKNSKEKIISICKFEFVDKVKSKNIKQHDLDSILKLIAIDYIKSNDNYEINLIFDNNACITLFTEIIEIRLEDQNETVEK